MVENIQPFFRLFRPGCRHKNAVGLKRPTANASAQLVKLCQAQLGWKRTTTYTAFSTIITVAFGTLIPTSTTVVETRI